MSGDPVRPLKQDCTTCRWAKWTMTRHKPPRVNRDLYGACLYPLSRIVVPSALRNTVTDLERRASDPPHLFYASAYTNCSTWEGK